MGGKGSGNRLAYKNAKGAKSPVIGDNGLSVKPERWLILLGVVLLLECYGNR